MDMTQDWSVAEWQLDPPFTGPLLENPYRVGHLLRD